MEQCLGLGLNVLGAHRNAGRAVRPACRDAGLCPCDSTVRPVAMVDCCSGSKGYGWRILEYASL